jgi:hypothetical protein
MQTCGSHLPGSRYIRAHVTRRRLLRLRNVRHDTPRHPLPEHPEHGAVATEVCFAATPLNLLSSCHARLSISVLLPLKMLLLPRFWPLFRHDYEQSHALDLVRPLLKCLLQLYPESLVPWELNFRGISTVCRLR